MTIPVLQCCDVACIPCCCSLCRMAELGTVKTLIEAMQAHVDSPNLQAGGVATMDRRSPEAAHVRQSRLFDFSPELPVNQGDACCAIVNIAQDDVGKKKVNELGALCWGSAVLALSGKLL